MQLYIARRRTPFEYAFLRSQGKAWRACSRTPPSPQVRRHEHRKPLRRNPVTVARRAGQTFAFAQLLLWATVNDTIVVGSNYWNVGVAGKGGKLDADQDTEGIGVITHMADNMAHVLKQLKKWVAMARDSAGMI